MNRVELRRRGFLSRVFNAPRLFLRFFRIGYRLPIAQRLYFAAWQAWASVKGF